MKIYIQCIVLLVVGSLGIFGCTSTGERSQIKEEIKEATGVTNVDWAERRTNMLRKSKERISDIEADTKRLKEVSLKDKSNVVKEKVRAQVVQTQLAVTEANKNLDNLERATAENWQDSEKNFIDKMNVLESHFGKLRALLK
jgi:hypothetical protein